MLPIAYTNPDSRNDGKKVSTIASWLARSWLRVTMLIAMPNESAPARKIAAIAKSNATLPRRGTWNKNSPMTTASSTSSMPNPKYGNSLPRTISLPFTGVEMSCSIVPVSHSRATVRDVSSAAITDITTAISPGMM